MKKIFPILLVIIYASPIFGIDLYSKYKAHNYFINDDVTSTSSIKINKYIMLDQPKRNYGGIIFFTTADKDKRNYWVQLIVLITAGFIITIASSYSGVIGRIVSSLVVGGVIGNVSEIIIFGGVTDFIYFNNTGIFLDRAIANLADMFILIPMFILILINVILIATKLFYYSIFHKN